MKWTDSKGNQHHDMGTCYCGAHHALEAERSLRERVEAAEARATELERELEQMRRSATEDNAAYQVRVEVSREYLRRAERAETALPLLDRVIDQGVCRWHDSDQSDPTPLHAWLGLTEDEYSAWVEGQSAKLVARAALGETPPKGEPA